MVGKIQLLHKHWIDFWETSETYPSHENIRFLCRIGLLGLLYFYINHVIQQTAKIPISYYKLPFITWESIKHLFSSYKNFVALPLVLMLGIYWRRVGVKWEVFSYSKAIRFITLLATGVLTWVFSTYEYNLFCNQAHFADRILLIVLLPFIWRRPIFILPYLFILHSIIGQFIYLNLYPIATFHLPIHILMFVLAYYLFYLVTKTRHISDFVFLFGCMYFAHYWWSGWNKVDAEWIFYDQISHVTSVMYANGWISFLEPETIGNAIQQLESINAPLRLIVLGLELGCMFFLLHHKFARFLLIGFISFHIGAFLMYGICFWVWVIMDLGFLWLLWQKDGISQFFRFNKYQMLFSFALIFFCYRWNTLTALSWHSSPLGYTYRFEALCEDGNTYHLPPQFFAPYDFQFTMNNFKYLQKEPLFNTFWGATNASTARYFRQKPSIEEIFEYEEAQFSSYYDETRKLVFEDFMKKWLKNWNERLSNKTWMSAIQAPEHLWTFPLKTFPNQPQRIEKVKVIEMTTLYKDREHLELRKRPVYELSTVLKK